MVGFRVVLVASAFAAAIWASSASAAGPVKGGCLLRFSAIIEDPKGLAFGSSQGSVVSPLYALAPKDCPALATGIDEYAVESDATGITTRAGLTGMEGKTAKHQAGKRIVGAFGAWLFSRQINPKLTLRKAATMIVLPDTAFNRERYAKDVGASTYFIEKAGPGGVKQVVPANSKWGPTAGNCLDYAPEGVTSVEVLGRDGCKGWLK